MDPNYRIRTARNGELAALPEIERLAAGRFAPYGLADVFAGIVIPLEMLRERARVGQVWVAVQDDDPPVGFAVASTLADHAHLDELDVLPEHGRRGIGSALTETVCGWAKSVGHRSITLSTLRHVPWNAPFYAKLAFRILPETEWSEPLRHLLEFEGRLGLPMRDRVLMRREL